MDLMVWIMLRRILVPNKEASSSSRYRWVGHRGVEVVMDIHRIWTTGRMCPIMGHERKPSALEGKCFSYLYSFWRGVWRWYLGVDYEGYEDCNDEMMNFFSRMIRSFDTKAVYILDTWLPSSSFCLVFEGRWWMGWMECMQAFRIVSQCHLDYLYNKYTHIFLQSFNARSMPSPWQVLSPPPHPILSILTLKALFSSPLTLHITPNNIEITTTNPVHLDVMCACSWWWCSVMWLWVRMLEKPPFLSHPHR